MARTKMNTIILTFDKLVVVILPKAQKVVLITVLTGEAHRYDAETFIQILTKVNEEKIKRLEAQLE